MTKVQTHQLLQVIKAIYLNDLVVAQIQYLKVNVELESAWSDVRYAIVLQEQIYQVLEERKVLDVRANVQEGQPQTLQFQ